MPRRLRPAWVILGIDGCQGYQVSLGNERSGCIVRAKFCRYMIKPFVRLLDPVVMVGFGSVFDGGHHVVILVQVNVPLGGHPTRIGEQDGVVEAVAVRGVPFVHFRVAQNQTYVASRDGATARIFRRAAASLRETKLTLRKTKPTRRHTHLSRARLRTGTCNFNPACQK